MWAVIVANLLAFIGLAFAYPHLMVSPGPLIPQHAALTTDCFACHEPLRGVATDRCISCHAVTEIGLRTMKGAAIEAPPAAGSTRLRMSFHQQLTEQNCMACHSDHADPKLTKRIQKPFSHALLRVETRNRCESCHAPPANDMHRDLKIGCAQCHMAEGWKPASFDHAALPASELEQCQTCHKPPTDALHRQIKAGCGQCHTPTAWKPATFDHSKFFVLDEDHNASCATCHIADDYTKYTCYGCHEHTPANVRRKHIEEGIQNFENCAHCHRSAHAEGGGKGEQGDGRRRGERD